MDSNTEIVLEVEPAESNEVSAGGEADARALPFSFAKRHGVLIREFKDGIADTIYRAGASPLSLAEARRFAGVPLQLTRVTAEAFDGLLQQTYEQGSHKAMQMVGESHRTYRNLRIFLKVTMMRQSSALSMRF